MAQQFDVLLHDPLPLQLVVISVAIAAGSNAHGSTPTTESQLGAVRGSA